MNTTFFCYFRLNLKILNLLINPFVIRSLTVYAGSLSEPSLLENSAKPRIMVKDVYFLCLMPVFLHILLSTMSVHGNYSIVTVRERTWFGLINQIESTALLATL